MNFKDWMLLKESIIVKWYNDDCPLQYVSADRHLTTEFCYQWEEGFSTYFIATQQATRPGYVSFGERATHVLITKTDAIQAGEGIDVSFIKSLYAALSKQFKPVPYKEGDSGWVNMLNKAAKQEDPNFEKVPQPQSQFGQSEVPDFSQGASNAVKITGGISASRASGSWAYIIQTDSANYVINWILEEMKKAVQPLLDKSLIDYYEIINRESNKRVEIKYSAEGKKRDDDRSNEFSRNIAYLKYLATFFGPHTIAAAERALSLDATDRAVKANNYKIPFAEVIKWINNARSENAFLRLMIYAMQHFDEKKNAVVEKIAEYDKTQTDTYKKKNPTSKIIPNYLESAAHSVIALWDEKMETEYGRSLWKDLDDVEEFNFMARVGTVFDLCRNINILKQLVPKELETFMDMFSKSVGEYLDATFKGRLPVEPEAREDNLKQLRDAFSDAKSHATYGYDSLVKIKDYLSLDRDHKDILDAIAEGLGGRDERVKKERGEQARRAEETAQERSFLLDGEEYKYLVMPDVSHWTNIPTKYLDYQTGGKYDINVGEFVMNDSKVGIPHDIEHIRYAALEQAEEELQANLESKPSESYGEDQSQVDEDIDDNLNDFLDAYEFDDIDESTPESQALELVKKNYRDDFIEWWKKELEGKEERESWKYEIDYSDSDYQEKVADTERAIAEEAAWDEGLVTLKKEEPDEVEIWLHKKYYEAFLPCLKKMLKANIQAKDEEFSESLLKHHYIVEVYFVDQNKKIRKTVGDWLTAV